MEDRGADADEAYGYQHQGVAACAGEHDQAGQGEAHTYREGIGLWFFVGVQSYKWLEQGCCQLEAKGDEPELAKVQFQGMLQQGVSRRYEGLHGIVEQMREADGQQDGEDRFLNDGVGVGGCGCCCCGHGKLFWAGYFLSVLPGFFWIAVDDALQELFVQVL